MLKLRELPAPARNYIIYHTIISPLLIIWYMVPLYMFMTGYNVLEVGAFYTIVNLSSIPITFLIGKAFEKIPLRHGLVLIDALDGIASIFYGLSIGPLAPLFLFAGLLIEKYLECPIVSTRPSRK